MTFNIFTEVVKAEQKEFSAKSSQLVQPFEDGDDDIFGYEKFRKPLPVRPEQSLKGQGIKSVFEPGIQTRSLELQYAECLKVNPGLRVSHQGENSALYQWGGSCWNRLSDTEGKRMAWDWLKLVSPKTAKERGAASLFATSLLELSLLPPSPRESIIPLADHWLVVSDDGQFHFKKPDMALGVTYHIKASLKSSAETGRYVPLPLPEDSLFSRFLSLSLPNEGERALVQEYCGYTLLNDVRFQKAQVWVGDGCNGKSVLLKIVEQLHSKVGSIRLDELSGFGLSPLVDSSLIICAEAPKRGINEQELKKIISGDSVSIEYKFKDVFSYSPTAKMLVACNRFPNITDDSDGVWRRLQIIRWDVKIGKGQQIPNLDRQIIEQEMKLVVDWCLEGLSRLLQRGDFNEPESVQLRKEAEKVNSNNVLAFADDYALAVSSGGCATEKEKLLAVYQEYCEANGLSAFHGTEFWKRIKQKFPGILEQKKTVRNRRVRVVNLVFGTGAAPSNDNVVCPFEGESSHV